MIKYKNFKSIFFASVLTIGITVITSHNIFAATLEDKTYTVKKGDCLYSIAKTHGESLDSLRQANNKWDNSISSGQVLNVSTTASPTVDTASHESIPYTKSDVDLLARLISAEAQGEPYDAQVAVGAVVVNRVKSNLFPNSISAVINQTVSGCYQFTDRKSVV